MFDSSESTTDACPLAESIVFIWMSAPEGWRAVIPAHYSQAELPILYYL
jgi:hypothetical protein